jgi:hypothetical protein
LRHAYIFSGQVDWEHAVGKERAVNLSPGAHLQRGIVEGCEEALTHMAAAQAARHDHKEQPVHSKLPRTQPQEVVKVIFKLPLESLLCCFTYKRSSILSYLEMQSSTWKFA